MKKFLTVLCLCFVSVVAFGEPTYNCKLQDKQKTGFLGLNARGGWGNDYVGYLYCGHVGTDGCKDGAVVVMNDDSLQRCNNHAWETILNDEINKCPAEKHVATAMEKIGYKYYISGDYVVFYNPQADTEEITEYCRMWLGYLEEFCIDSGGKWESTVCDCSGNETLQREGDAPFLPCECKDGFKRGDDNKCWPKDIVDGKCWLHKPSGQYTCPTDIDNGDLGPRDYDIIKYGSTGTDDDYVWINLLKTGRCDCMCDEKKRLCNINGTLVWKETLACPGFSEADVLKACAEYNYTEDRDNNGYDCIKLTSQYNYKSCSTDADCTGIDNKKSPYLHSTAWKCIEQTAGVRVCAARECETGWTPINGYCQQQTKATNPVQTSVSPTLPGNTPDDITAPVQTPNCSDPINMDADCKCTRVAETVERGGVCVCADSNKEIKNGKCEYTAAYRSKLKTDIDSKYSKIKSLTASFEVNKWKDAEGNFNTARLASDSIAGVVLGTVGGVVTARLVKKSQIKKGFEDIQCHIGGQPVADYGDEFTVGR